MMNGLPKIPLPFIKNLTIAMIIVLQEGNAYLTILGSGNIVVEKCPGFQSNLCKFLMEVVRIIIVVIKESVNNRQDSRSKTAAPFQKTLIILDKGVIRVLLVRRMEMLYKGGNRSRDCDYMWNLVSTDKVPYVLLNRHILIIRNYLPPPIHIECALDYH